ncbi:hypothetical protein F4802DRAFT_20918 [Xylaria palmicola]|nr:hypothetical protein F4802DRAFT_20918 [Xylaria palmicola]
MALGALPVTIRALPRACTAFVRQGRLWSMYVLSVPWRRNRLLSPGAAANMVLSSRQQPTRTSMAGRITTWGMPCVGRRTGIVIVVMAMVQNQQMPLDGGG